MANRILNNKQHTVRFHVDDILLSHVDSQVNDDFVVWLQKTYGEIKDLSTTRGKKHKFLGMKLDFSEDGVCNLRQDSHVKDFIYSWPEKFKVTDKVSTAAALDLFDKGSGVLLDKEKRETFHSVITKIIFIFTRSRPDVLPKVGLLVGRVREPNQRHWDKGRRVVRDFTCTRDLHLILAYDGLKICKWSVDATFTVNPDFKIHSGGLMMLSKMGRGMASGSTKQKLNTCSSTEAKMVSSDDFLTKIIWCKTFLGEQGIRLNQNILLQDNLSTKMLMEKGRISRKKISHTINIRYLSIKDYYEISELKIEHFPTDYMVGDFMIKPLQGLKFKNFRKLILGL